MKPMSDYQFSYELEELVPIVSGLAAQYTGNESTSITYERARQLMEAVIYCIREYEESMYADSIERSKRNLAYSETISQQKCNLLLNKTPLSAREAYNCGYKLTKEKYLRVREKYRKMMQYFNCYGNLNYRDTVEKGLTGFFQYYDIRFCPQDTIITMDYPTLIPITDKRGIDAIEEYVRQLSLEALYLNSISEEEVIDILTSYQKSYKSQFYNLCSIIFRRKLYEYCSEEKFMNKEIYTTDYSQLESEVRFMFEQKFFIKQTDSINKSEEAEYIEIKGHLSADIHNFIVELLNYVNRR